MGQTFLRSAAQCFTVVAFLILTASNAFGQGSNPFFTPPTFPGGNGQEFSADINGDGNPDLLFVDGTVLLGKGDGTFTVGAKWKQPSLTLSAAQFAIADFNGDGKPDIMVAGPVNLLSVFLGKGDGTFQVPITTSIAVPATGFVVGDLNRDGKPDVLAQVGSSILTFLGQGDGTFAAGIASNASLGSLADFNGDAKLDLFTNQGIQLGNGDGTFQAFLPFPAGAIPGWGFLGDFDDDGKLDIALTVVAANASDPTIPQIQVLFGEGDGTFRVGSAQTLSQNFEIAEFAAVDLNGDGKTDLVGSTGSAVQVLISKGDGTFTPGKIYNAPGAPSGGITNLVVDDFNHDGKKDVAAFNTMLLGNGDGTLQGDEAVPGLPGLGVSGDFNGDGHQDLALTSQPVVTNSGAPTTFAVTLNIGLNDGKANFTLAHSYQIPIPSPGVDSPGAVVITSAADINGDGKLDLLGYLWDGSDFNLITLLGNGDGSFGAPIATAVSGVGSWQNVGGAAIALGDLNGDKRPDAVLVVSGKTGPFGFFVLLGNGDGTFGAPSSPFVSQPGSGPALGDFNNDKKLDVVLGTSNGIGVLLGNGDGSFQPTTYIPPTNSCCGSLLSGDFNGDGKLDLFVPAISPGASGYQVLLGKGDGTFNPMPAATLASGELLLTQVADFNGDGNLDVLGRFLTNSDDTLALFLGKGDGTFNSPFLFGNGEPVLVADFNGDGKPDIALFPGNQLVWLFNSAQTAAPPPPTAPPDFSLGAGSGGGTAAVAPGSTASYSLSLAGSGGFSGSVALTCSVAPAGPACSVSPSSVMVTGGTAASATVSVTTTAKSGLLPIGRSNDRDSSRRILWIFGLSLAMMGVFISFARGRMRQRRFSWSVATACAAMLLISVSLLSGCGGGSSNSSGSSGSTVTGTPAGSYTVTVTAQSGSVSHETQLTLTVQ